MSDQDSSQSHSDDPYVDPVIEYYKKQVDRAALRENLKLTVEERLMKLQRRLLELEERQRAAE